MEENTAAVESLILFYINTKQLLKTKQLDERVFLDQMIRHCRENGFDSYSNEEIRNTWKNLVLKYAELKKSGSVEEKECWKYYEILDSCYEQSDFHNGVYPKFSEEMVWFLIECFLKRRGLEKTQKRNSMLTEIHKDFLHSGYLYVTKQDIENKWKYLNVKYDKLKDDSDAFNKLPFLQAVTRFREKEGKCLVKIIFTRELTEILIERFTEKKITCVIHGYDSEQVLSEIQSEFRDLGFDFTQEEIKERWRKLTVVYSFLKAKGKDDSSWVYFNAMKEHFKDDFLFKFGNMGSENLSEEENKVKPVSRPRSKSMSADSRIKLNSHQIKSNLIVSIQQLDKNVLSPLPEQKSVDKIVPSNKNKLSTKRLLDNDTKNLHVSSKKLKSRSKSKEKEITENSVEDLRRLDKNVNETDLKKTSVPKRDGITLRKNVQLTRLTIDQNGNQERRSSVELGSPGSKVHIINIDGSEIDKTSGNLTINLPSITKQFSDNEFLPLKKRLRLDGYYGDKQDGNEIKDGFLGFPATEVAETRDRLKSDSNESKRLTEEEMAEIMERINEDKSEKYGLSGTLPAEDTSYFKPDGFNYNYLGPYNSFNQPCLIIPKDERKDNLPLQTYNNSNAITPPPVLLLVIKVDGSNSLSKDGAMNEVKKEIEKRLKDSPVKNKPGQSTSVRNLSSGGSPDFVKPDSSNSRNCTVTCNKNITITPIVEPANREPCEAHKIDVDKTSVNVANPGNGNPVAENAPCLITEREETKSNHTHDIPVKNNGLIKLSSPKGKSLGKSCTINLNEKAVVLQSAGIKAKEESNVQSSNIETSSTASAASIQGSPSPKKNEQPLKPSEAVPIVTTETDTTASSGQQQADAPKSVRLPVKGGGKVKEIFISSQELKKISQLKPENFKLKRSTVKPTNVSQNMLETTATAKLPPKIKFMSQTIKPARGDASIYSKMERMPVRPLPRAGSMIDLTAEDNQMLPPPSTSFAANNKFLGTNNSSNVVNKNVKNEDFDNESVFSEAVGDDDGLKDNLLATVIDFQEQNNQEFVEIKNLMKQNNLLQRETNRLLRLMLEKM